MISTLRAVTVCVWAGVAWLTMAQAIAANFDCNRARSKLNRAICSDAALSRLDETVWNAYGERIRGLTALQYAHVRERHLLWRRSRGLYETTVEALTHEYLSHLAWLTHPLLGLEGRYQRSGLASSAAHLEVEVDVRSPQALEVRGLATTPIALAWQASARHALNPGSLPTTPQRGPGIRLTIQPQLLGNAASLSATCEFNISFADDQALLASNGECGANFDGAYARTLRD